jgi:hypothetical protein
LVCSGWDVGSQWAVIEWAALMSWALWAKLKGEMLLVGGGGTTNNRHRSALASTSLSEA